MSNMLEIAEAALLAPSGLDEAQLQTVLGKACTASIDAADLYMQSVETEDWILEEGVVKEGTFNIERGVGIRAISGEKTGFAYTDEIILPSLLTAASAAHAIGQQRRLDRTLPVPHETRGLNLYPQITPLNTLTEPEKAELLRRVDGWARAADPRVKEVIVNLSARYEVILIMDHEGRLVPDVRPLVRLDVSVVVEDGMKRERGNGGGGARAGYEWFMAADNRAKAYAEEAVRIALLKLEAVPAPAGSMPVVLGPGWPGVLLHEAVGHGLEGDFNRKGSSAFAGRLGERVATDLCTVVDDGTLPGRRGSLNVDDEGTPTECTVLIENGILKNYMQDKLNARLMGMTPTGNGRRESYASLPIPRMTNTYMLPGQSDPDEIISSVEHGIYAVNFGGGQVDTTSGKFVFSTTEAYLIEHGKLTHPIKSAMLIGDGPAVLTKVSMVGNDLKLDEGVGICGKEGQSVPVGVGQPTLKIDDLTVGGTG